MEEFLKRLEQAADLREVQSLVDGILDTARAGKGKREEKRLFLRHLLFNQTLLSRLETPDARTGRHPAPALSQCHPDRPFVLSGFVFMGQRWA